GRRRVAPSSCRCSWRLRLLLRRRPGGRAGVAAERAAASVDVEAVRLAYVGGQVGAEAGKRVLQGAVRVDQVVQVDPGGVGEVEDVHGGDLGVGEAGGGDAVAAGDGLGGLDV